MVLLHILLIGLLSGTESKKSQKKPLGDGLIAFTPISLNRARFLSYQHSPLRRLPARGESRKPIGPAAPLLICGEGVMGVVMKYPFNGRIFASHREKDPECLQYVTVRTLPKFLTSLHGQCGVWSKTNTVSLVTEFHLRIVVSFGYEYLTEEDKIYDLTCAYSPKNVSVGAYYDTINFVALPLRNDSVLPTCHYSLRLNTLDGQRVQKAMIGQLVYHRWSCPSEEFAFKVYRCYIHNGLHQSYMIINENGCSLDESIMPHPTYDSARHLVYTASKAFRFTTSRRVFFNCMLSVCHRTDEGCMQDIPPHCPRVIRKRHLSPPDDFSVEERLERLQMLVDGGNYTTNGPAFQYVPIVSDDYDSSQESETTPMMERLPPIDGGSSIPSCEPSGNPPWTRFLLVTNFFSLLIIILMCCTATRRRHHIVGGTKVHSPHLSLY